MLFAGGDLDIFNKDELGGFFVMGFTPAIQWSHNHVFCMGKIATSVFIHKAIYRAKKTLLITIVGSGPPCGTC